MIIQKVIQRIEMQYNLFYKYNYDLKKISNHNPQIILNVLFKEREIIDDHCRIILEKHIFITEKDIDLMNIEICNHEKNIINIIKKYY